MHSWEALVLGIIQGLTEFLPVSSSGHLELGQLILGFKDLHHYILFDVVCHLGTLCAIFYIFLPKIMASLTTQKTRLIQIILGTLPLFPLVLLLKPIKEMFNQPQFLGYCFLFTAFLLFIGQIKRAPRPVRWSDPVTIGLFQAAAILPGVSRSGSTISAACLLGWSKEEAVSFSFMLAIPAILGATVIEMAQLIRNPALEAPSISFFSFFIGFSSSFVVGCLSLRLLMRMVLDDKWVYFAWYCLFLGIMTTWWFNF